MDLEKNARIYAGIPEDSPLDLKYCVMDKKAKYDAFIAGANWQKQQDQSTIEIAEDHAMFAGMEKMKQQMMANAVDAVVKIDAGGYPYVDRTIELYDYDKDIPLAKRGDKVKILVIKED